MSCFHILLGLKVLPTRLAVPLILHIRSAYQSYVVGVLDYRDYPCLCLRLLKPLPRTNAKRLSADTLSPGLLAFPRDGGHFQSLSPPPQLSRRVQCQRLTVSLSARCYFWPSLSYLGAY